MFSACFSISLHIIDRFCVFNIQLTFLSACFFPFLYIFLFLQREFVKKNALTLLRSRAMIDIWDCRRFPHVGADSRVCPLFLCLVCGLGMAGRHGSLPLRVTVSSPPPQKLRHKVHKKRRTQCGLRLAATKKIYAHCRLRRCTFRRVQTGG